MSWRGPVSLVRLAAVALALAGWGAGRAAAQESGEVVRARLVSGALAAARVRLATNPDHDLGRKLLSFALLLEEKNREALALRDRVNLDEAVFAPSPLPNEAEYVAYLQQVARTDANARRALLLFTLATHLDPTAKEAQEAVAAALNRGEWANLNQSLTAGRRPTLDEKVDFAGSAEALSSRVLRRDLDGGGDAAGGAARLAELCDRRQKARGSDEALAALTKDFLGELGRAIAARTDAQAQWRKAREFEPPFKNPDPEKHAQAQREGRERRMDNVLKQWQTELTSHEKGRAAALLTQLRAAQDKLWQMVAATERRVGAAAGSGAVAGPDTPPAGPPAERPPPRPERPPEVASTPPGDVPPEPVRPLPPEANAVTEPPGQLDAYDTTPAPTPDGLQGSVEEMGLWLKTQQERLGAALVTRVFARQQGRRAVLYLYVSDGFQRLAADRRQQLAESFWRYWSMRCETNRRVRSTKDAQAVLADGEGNIVGGSAPTDGSAIWVAK